MKTKYTQTLLAIALATLCGAVQAAPSTATGNLSVATTVSANCNAPSPSGNLVLPFSGSATLLAQSLATEITVNISCSGAPTLSSLAFGVGANAPTKEERLLAKGTDKLGYKLYASRTQGAAGGDETGLRKLTSGSPSTPDASSSLALDGSSATVYVNGRVYHTDGNGGISYSSAGAVPAGSYSDTVTMTLTYN